MNVVDASQGDDHLRVPVNYLNLQAIDHRLESSPITAASIHVACCPLAMIELHIKTTVAGGLMVKWDPVSRDPQPIVARGDREARIRRKVAVIAATPGEALCTWKPGQMLEYAIERRRRSSQRK